MTPDPTPPGPGDTARAELHRGQLRMAERLATTYTEHLRYAHGLGWHTWDGTRWAPDRNGYPARAAIDTLKTALRDLADIGDPNVRKELFDDVRRCESAAAQTGILQIASNLHPLAVAAADLDADPWLFNLRNGTLDLHTGDLRPHNPTDLISKVAGCGLDPDAAGPVFDKFISEILPADDVRGFVQRLFGSAMFGRVRDHILPIFTGAGANGKSTLVELMRHVFGDYAIAAEPDLLIDRGYSHPTGQADLLGIRLATTMETDEGKQLAAATVKRLTGGDQIRARRMRQDFFEFEPSHTAVLVTNRLPHVRGDDPAVWRRIRVVPFDVVITNIDAEMGDKLGLELPAVLAWALAGYRAWVDGGLDAPEAVVARTNQYRADSDPIARFLADCTMPSNSSSVYAYARDLYTAWCRWCQDTGEDNGTEKAFAEQMSRHDMTKVRRSGGFVYTKLMLLDQDSEPEEST